MSKVDRTLEGLFHLTEIVTDKDSLAALKMLESFKQECESFGIYDDRKSFAQLRKDLDQAKKTGRYIQ